MAVKYAPPLRGDHEQRMREGIEELRDRMTWIQAKMIAKHNHCNHRQRGGKKEIVRQIALYLQYEAVIKQLEKSLERHLQGKRHWS